jgi:Tol biopolymer transport system component
MAREMNGRLVGGAALVLATIVSACTEPDVRRPGLLAVTSGEAQEAEVGAALPAHVEVQVTDTGGRTVPRVVVNFRVSAPAAAGFTSGSVSPASAETDAGGTARVRWTLGTDAGVQTLHVWIGPSEDAAISRREVRATARPGVAASVVRVSPPIVAITVGDSALVQVAGTDRYGNPTPIVNVSWQSLDPAVARVSRLDGGAVVVGQAQGTTTLEAQIAVAGTLRFDIRTYAGPGRAIAFNSLGRILLLSADGATTTVLRENAADPAWSPDGRQIAFTDHPDSFRTGTGAAIHVMNADGSNVRVLTDTSTIGPARDPSWSPDGQKIAFIARGVHRPPLFGPVTSVYVMNADGSAPAQVGFGLESDRGAEHPRWSPDGTRLVFAGRRTSCFILRGVIFVVNADGSDQRQLYPAASGGLPNEFARDPTWSPDGRRVAFQLAPVLWDPPTNSCRLPGEFYTNDINPDGTGLRRLIEPRPANTVVPPMSSPAWAPDSRIVFVGTSPFGGSGLFVMNGDGTEVRRVSRLEGGVSRPAWRPTP